MIINILMGTLLVQFLKLKYLIIHAKYVLMKENKNLLYLNADTKYVQNVLNNLKDKKNMNHVLYVDKIIGMKKQHKIDIEN